MASVASLDSDMMTDRGDASSESEALEHLVKENDDEKCDEETVPRNHQSETNHCEDRSDWSNNNKGVMVPYAASGIRCQLQGQRRQRLRHYTGCLTRTSGPDDGWYFLLRMRRKAQP